MKGFTPSAKHIARVNDHQFPAQHGFSGSAGQVSVRPHVRQSPIMKKAMGGPAHAAGCSCAMCSGGAVMKKGGKVLKKADGGFIAYHDNPHKQSEAPSWSDYKKGGVAKPTLKLKKGALRKTLGVTGDKNIPAAQLEAATHSPNPLTRKRAVFAQNINSKK